MRLFVLALFAFLAVPLLAIAQATLPAVDPGAAVTGLLGAFHNHSWSLVASFGVMLLVWTVGKFNLLKFLPAAAVPWVSVALGALAAVATGLAAGHPFTDSLVTGIETGLAGVGAYETLGQHVLSSPQTSSPPA